MGSAYFLHLSDIHFYYSSNRPDLDRVIRKDLLNDLKTCKADYKKIGGVLISGDIAFSAQPEQYKIAKKWIREILDICHCDIKNLVLIPGNHDVDYAKSKRTSPKFYRISLRGATNQHNLDKIISGFYEDVAMDVLFDSFQAFNDFAVSYNCDIHPKNPVASKEIKIPGLPKFKIVGMNSCLASDKDEDNIKQGDSLINEQILTSYQLETDWDDKLFHISLCHHPTNWIKFSKEVEQAFDARFSIQLFGHEHKGRIITNGNNIKIFAGAIQPERDGDKWKPSYNFIKFTKADIKDHMEIEIIGRVWNKTSHSFGCDTPESHKYKIKLPKRHRLKGNDKTKISDQSETKEISIEMKNTDVIQKNLSAETYYSFFSLPHVIRLSILMELNVYDSSDGMYGPIECCKRGVLRIVKNKKETEFERLVVKNNGSGV